MRALVALILLPFLLAGCAGSPSDDPAALDPEAAAPAPEPVDIHEVVDLVQGGSATWTFEVGPGATTVEMRFFATAKAVTGTHLATCLTVETPANQESTRVCDSLSPSVVVSPSQPANERTFYEASGAGAPVGTYTFTLDAGPSPTDFHALVTVSY